jgi:hypothetical protein
MAGKGAPPLTGVGESPGGQATVLTHGFGLKCGILQGDPRAFLSALEGAVKTRRTSAWQLNALNRQSAQIILNEPFEPDGAVASAAAGTILNVRPIVRGGLVHLDIRREVDLGAAGSGSPSAALTHQIVLREGQTAVVGGFYAEYLAARSNAAAGVGEAPLAGRVSRRQSGVIERSETIVILTPHVVYSKSVEPGQSRRAHVPRATGGDRPIVQQTAGTLDPPRRLPAGSTATVRLMGAEAPGGDPTTDVETIPVLELPGENEPRPTIRPAGAK